MKDIIDFLTKLIPFLEPYPGWVKVLIAIWLILGMVFTAVVVVCLLFTRRRAPDGDATIRPKDTNSKRIEGAAVTTKDETTSLAAIRHVFLSYCHDNTQEADQLRSDLIAAGEAVWWDKDILPGQDWKQAIRAAMRESHAVIVCLSKELASRGTSGVYPEIRDAIAMYRECPPDSIFLIPVRLSECKVPPIEIDATQTLERLQYVDLFPDSDRAKGLKRLIAAIHKARTGSASPTPAAKEEDAKHAPPGKKTEDFSTIDAPAGQTDDIEIPWLVANYYDNRGLRCGQAIRRPFFPRKNCYLPDIGEFALQQITKAHGPITKALRFKYIDCESQQWLSPETSVWDLAEKRVKILILVDEEMERWENPQAARSYCEFAETDAEIAKWLAQNPFPSRPATTQQTPQDQYYRVAVERQADASIVIDVSPTQGEWTPFAASIPSEEKERVRPILRFPHEALAGYREGTTANGLCWSMIADNSARPGKGYQIVVKETPTVLFVGNLHSQARQYVVAGNILRNLLGDAPGKAQPTKEAPEPALPKKDNSEPAPAKNDAARAPAGEQSAVRIHVQPNATRRYAIEMRPTAASWCPFAVAIPVAEREKVNPSILPGPKGLPPTAGVLTRPLQGVSEEGDTWVLSAQDEATPQKGYFLFCDQLPTVVHFGSGRPGEAMFTARPKELLPKE